MIDFVPFSDKKKEQKDLKPIINIPLGLWSFDKAFAGYQGKVGLPLDAFVEVSGRTSTGKSTLIYSLAGLFSIKLNNKTIAMVDLEGFDPNHMSTILQSTGYAGNVKLCTAPTDEKSLDNLVEAMFDGAQIGFLDSIGAISPLGEKEGEIGESNMGQRAKRLAQLSRKGVHMMNNTKEPRIIWLNNHLNANLSGRGSITPGGETKNYISTVQIRLSRKEEFLDGSYVLEGKVTKNRYGYKNRIFHLFILSGFGIHHGLSAMWDGMLAGKVTRNAGGISIGDEKYGKLSRIVKQESRKEDQSFFTPFHELLKGTTDADNTDFESERDTDGSSQDTEVSD